MIRKAVACKHCKRVYLKPCKDDKQRDRCPNWRFLQAQKSEKPKQSKPRK